MPVFEFQAQQRDGLTLEGMMPAVNASDVETRLRLMGVQVVSIRPATQPARSARLGAADLELFNEQLMQLTIAGLPIERGLELLASDVRSRRLRGAMEALAADLSGGKPIERALEDRRSQFPPIYGRLIDAGIRTSNLPAVLHGFGRHLRTVARLRSELWRACAYPLMILLAFSVLMIFLSYWVLPQYYGLIKNISWTTWSYDAGRKTNTPGIPFAANVLFYVGRAMPYFIGVLLGALAIVFGGWALLRWMNRERPWIDSVILRLPLVGPALRQNYVARWTDALSIALGAGLDLPRAIQLAGQVVALPSIEQDGQALIAHLQAGQSLETAPRLHRVPASIPPAMALASQNGNLPHVMSALSRQFERQAEQRISLIPSILVPLLVLIIGVVAGGIFYGLWVPLARLLQGMLR